MSKDVAAGPGQELGKGGSRSFAEGKGRTFNPRLRFNPQYADGAGSADTRKRNTNPAVVSPSPNSSGAPGAVPPGTPTPRGAISLVTTQNVGNTASPGAKKFNPRATFNPKANSTLSSHPSVVGLASTNGAKKDIAVHTDHASAGAPGAPFAGLTRDFRVALDRAAGQQSVLMPLQYHLYAPSPFRVRPSLQPHERLAEDLFIPENLRQELLQRNEATIRVLPGESMLPEQVHVYHTLVPLDTQVGTDEMLGHRKWNYKAVSTVNGRTYCLTRVSDFELTHERAMSFIQRWMTLRRCSSLVGVIEAFTTVAFGDHSLVVVYEFFPSAEPLSAVYTSLPVPENLCWTIISQLVNAITTVHSANLAVRTLSVRSVLVTSKNRVRVGYGALRDVLEFEQNNGSSIGASNSTNASTSSGSSSNPSSASTSVGSAANLPNAASSTFSDCTDTELAEQQRQDWHCLAAIVKKLCSSSRSNDEDGDEALVVSGGGRAYTHSAASASLNKLYGELLSEKPSSDAIMTIMAPHLLSTMNNAMSKADVVESTLCQELENGRLVRLLCKLEFVIDRPSQINDPAWMPKGEFYPLRLLRHYIFHQRDEMGYATTDLAHVLATLNKLDAGLDENLLLISPDGKTRIIMSYTELKSLIFKQFSELVAHNAA